MKHVEFTITLALAIVVLWTLHGIQAKQWALVLASLYFVTVTAHVIHLDASLRQARAERDSLAASFNNMHNEVCRLTELLIHNKPYVDPPITRPATDCTTCVHNTFGVCHHSDSPLWALAVGPDRSCRHHTTRQT